MKAEKSICVGVASGPELPTSLSAVDSFEPRRTNAGRAPLAPMRVVAVDRRRVTLEPDDAGDGAPFATLALGYPYEPTAGDVLLVVGDVERWVIGVVDGRGKVDLKLHGDVELHAEGGALTLRGDKGVHVRGPELDVTVERVAIAASHVVEKCATLYQRIRESLTVHARESVMHVDETALQHAKKVAVLADETASVNGKQILLG
jgi:hypothetical protein